MITHDYQLIVDCTLSTVVQTPTANANSARFTLQAKLEQSCVN